MLLYAVGGVRLFVRRFPRCQCSLREEIREETRHVHHLPAQPKQRAHLQSIWYVIGKLGQKTQI